MAQTRPEDGHVPGNILAALCATPYNGSFHWMIYIPKDENAGYKFHAHNEGNTGPWRYEKTEWSGMHSQTCVALAKIGRLDANNIDQEADEMDKLLREIPINVVPDIDRSIVGGTFTCRVWFRAAIRKLMHDSHGFVRALDINKLEDQLMKRATGIQFLRLGRSGPPPAILPPSDYTF